MKNNLVKSALISVYNKKNIEKIAKKFKSLNIQIISTGGTEKYLSELGFEIEKVENLTDYPSIFGGRVKTLHPKIFGGILHRRENKTDTNEKKKYNIKSIDFVIVDLYPFENTVNDAKSHDEIIEKIDIGGISLIRAAAKNFKNVVCVSSIYQYDEFLEDLKENSGLFSLEQKKKYAKLFEDYFLKSFSSRLVEYKEAKIVVISEDVKNEKYTIVFSKLIGTSDRPEVKIDWRVYTKDPENPMVRDLIIEGLSLARTQKEEFNSIIVNNDGSIEALFENLSKFIEN